MELAKKILNHIEEKITQTKNALCNFYWSLQYKPTLNVT